ncbi:2'-5' RNA ligase [Achromobacter xylosoxidans]|uniref:2'-5' RNA ligase n=1 Tax=Alcaligenes xylosoxydans xylosoxydans TaxID=85698 RepID=UPI000AABD42E|nr:2'-5' RNA ligase [Achromobacter xylosoxidans]
MNIWPFPNILPEDWAALPACDKAMLEALTAAYLAEIERRRPANVPAPNHDS